MDGKWKDYYERAVGDRCRGDEAKQSHKALGQSVKDGRLALLIGAGVTAGLVGNWKELLNELAIMRCGSQACKSDDAWKPDKPRLNQLRDYIKKVKDASFLPVDTGVLEQGEYLMYDPDDMEAQHLNRQTASDERWRERCFAAQVGDAIRCLTHKHLCDARGKMPKTLEKDFEDWCDNSADDVFGVRRRDVSNNDACVKALKDQKITAEALAEKLQDRYGLSTDLADLRAEAAKTKADAAEIEAAVFERLAAQAADALWRPGYGTLYQMLRLCALGGVQEVITYNFDTIFDRLLMDPDIQRRLGAKATRPVQVYSFHNERPVELKGANTDRKNADAVRIYHVHGILDGEEDKEARLPDMPIIFSENSYQTYQNRVMNWSNIRIAEAINTYDLLCVGFSGTDANFRNLVQLCRQLQGTPIFASGMNPHKVFLTRACKYDVDRYTKAKDTFTSEELECAFWCVGTYFDLVQMYYAYQLGITVLWSEDFDDMAKQLGQLI